MKAATFEATTQSKGQTLDNLKSLLELGKAINRVQDMKYYRDLRTPVIAGGAIRDTFFGLVPDDYDVFFDVSHIEDVDERDDFVLMYLNDLVAEARKSEKLRPDLQEAAVEALNSAYNPGDPTGFLVYQTSWAHALEMPEVPMCIQAIGRVDPRLAQDNPVSFLDSFDYSAVKVLYDPKTNQLFSHGEFDDFLKTRKIEVKDDQTYNRVQNWAGRFYPKPPFEIVDNRPKKMSDWDILFVDQSTNNTKTVWKYVQNGPVP